MKRKSRKQIKVPNHPNANNRDWVLYSIYLASKALGKAVPKGCPVHHFNRDIFNDTPSNLVLCEDNKYHGLLHRRTNKLYGRDGIIDFKTGIITPSVKMCDT